MLDLHLLRQVEALGREDDFLLVGRSPGLPSFDREINALVDLGLLGRGYGWQPQLSSVLGLRLLEGQVRPAGEAVSAVERGFELDPCRADRAVLCQVHSRVPIHGAVQLALLVLQLFVLGALPVLVD